MGRRLPGWGLAAIKNAACLGRVFSVYLFFAALRKGQLPRTTERNNQRDSGGIVSVVVRRWAKRMANANPVVCQVRECTRTSPLAASACHPPCPAIRCIVPLAC